MIDNENGRAWARFWLVVALAISVFGNVADTCLTDTDVHILLRLPGAILWPLFVFGGIEILVRINWTRSKRHILSRMLLISPALPAAIVSYNHLHDFLMRSGEKGIVQLMGPLAVDGLMVGCTVALLVTRSLPSPPQVPLLLPSPSPSVEEMEEIRERWEKEKRDISSPVAEGAEEYLRSSSLPPAPISPAPSFSPAPVSAPPARSRPGRGSSWPVAEVVRVILDGGGKEEALAAGAPSPTTYGRVRQAVALLREDPHAAVPPAWKVPDSVAQVIREMVPR